MIGSLEKQQICTTSATDSIGQSPIPVQRSEAARLKKLKKRRSGSGIIFQLNCFLSSQPDNINVMFDYDSNKTGMIHNLHTQPVWLR